MKIALVSTYDIEGGAARAALRLHRALGTLGGGVESRLFVQHQGDPDASIDGPESSWSKLGVRVRARADHLPAQALGIRRGEFSLGWLRSGINRRLERWNPDVVHLHWINAGFVALDEIAAIGRPLVWTAHDMWPFTGGCHYDAGCGRYEADGCTGCPMQHRARAIDVAAARFAAKARTSRQTGVEFVCPSRWLASVARSSGASGGRPVHAIPNGIDLEVYKPMDRSWSRRLYNLPEDRVVLLFGAMHARSDPRKGYAQLDEALKKLSVTHAGAPLMLVVFGSAGRREAQRHGFPVIEIGSLRDDVSLAALYSAADVFVAPSLQDNLPNTVLEATACGLPTVAYAIGGMPDLVEEGVSGLLADAADPGSLAARLAQAVDDAAWRKGAGAAAREKALREFSAEQYAQVHLRLYEQVIGKRTAP